MKRAIRIFVVMSILIGASLTAVSPKADANCYCELDPYCNPSCPNRPEKCGIENWPPCPDPGGGLK